MRPPDSIAAPSNAQLWTGRVLSALAVLFLTFDVVIKFMQIAPVAQSLTQLGIPVHFTLTIATIEAACLILYVIPRTSMLGAVLFTGYLGGAILANLRVELPLFSHVLFPTYVGALLWGGLYLRDTRLRTLIS
jgi:hypothetical protein